VSAHSDHSNSTARRNPDGMLRALGRFFAWHHRASLVNETLERRRLGALDANAWYVERDFMIGEVCVPFILFGPNGLFLVMASRGYWSSEHILHMRAAADRLVGMMADYPDKAHPVIVLLDDEREPRQEYASHGQGPCWVLGDGWLADWLESHNDLGFSEADIALLRHEADQARIIEPTRDFRPAGTGHLPRAPEDVYFAG
jgi:hypothetical protein